MHISFIHQQLATHLEMVGYVPNLNGWFENPQIWMTAVTQFTKIRCWPLKRGYIVMRWASNSNELSLLEHIVAGDLSIGSCVRSMTECTERIDTTGRIEITSCSDGIFSRIGRRTIASRIFVVLIIVVAHQFDHRINVGHFAVIASKNVCPGIVFVREPIAECIDTFLIPAQIEDGFKRWNVIRRPIA